MKPDPIATITIDGEERRVAFDLDCLLRIEQETGKPALEVFSMISVPKGTPDRLVGIMVLRKVPLAVAIDFVAGALNVHADQARVWARAGVLFKAFIDLAPSFCAAASE